MAVGLVESESCLGMSRSELVSKLGAPWGDKPGMWYLVDERRGIVLHEKTWLAFELNEDGIVSSVNIVMD